MNLLSAVNPAHPKGDNAHLLNQIHHLEAMELLSAVGDVSIDMALLDLPYG